MSHIYIYICIYILYSASQLNPIRFNQSIQFESRRAAWREQQYLARQWRIEANRIEWTIESSWTDKIKLK